MVNAFDIFDPQPITNWLLFFLALSGVLTLLVRWVVKGAKARAAAAQKDRDESRAELVELIKETTKPIQPNTNGGLSLPDLHAKFDKMDDKVNRIEKRYNEVIESEEEQREKWHALYLEDQKFHHSKLASVFVAIRKLLHIEDIQEQVKEWDAITEAYLDGTIVEKYPDKRNN